MHRQTVGHRAARSHQRLADELRAWRMRACERSERTGSAVPRRLRAARVPDERRVPVRRKHAARTCPRAGCGRETRRCCAPSRLFWQATRETGDARALASATRRSGAQLRHGRRTRRHGADIQRLQLQDARQSAQRARWALCRQLRGRDGLRGVTLARRCRHDEAPWRAWRANPSVVRHAPYGGHAPSRTSETMEGRPAPRVAGGARLTPRTRPEPVGSPHQPLAPRRSRFDFTRRGDGSVFVSQRALASGWRDACAGAGDCVLRGERVVALRLQGGQGCCCARRGRRSQGQGCVWQERRSQGDGGCACAGCAQA